MTNDEAAIVLRAYNGWRVDDPAYPDMPDPVEITQALDLAIAALSPKPEVCEWSQSDDPDFSWWDTSCGEAWTFIESDPSGNGMKFCPYCGKELCANATELPDDVRNDE